MESFLIAIAPELITLASTILIALAGWGVMLLRKKINAELPEHTLNAANSALDVVDHAIDAIVGNLSQTVAKQIKAASKDGHLPKAKRAELKLKAMNEARALILTEVRNVAQAGIVSLDEYVSKRIEERVIANKTGPLKRLVK